MKYFKYISEILVILVFMLYQLGQYTFVSFGQPLLKVSVYVDMI